MAELQQIKKLPYGEILEKLPLIRKLLSVIHEKDDKEEMDICVDKLCEAFRKEGLETDAVLSEIEMWLWYFTGQSQSDKNADRCLRFFVKCGLRMLLQDTVTPRLFTLLVEHIKKIQFAVSDASRYRCCQLITYIFEGIEEIEADYEPTDDQEDGSLPAEMMNILVKILKERLCDKSPFVRAEVICSLSVLCRINDNLSDGETGFDCTKHIVNALWDISRDVRKEAVRNVPLFSESDISTFISMILEENDNNIRHIAFGRIACNLHVRSLTVQQRMQLLKVTFTGDDVALRKIAERMIINWAGSEWVPLLNLLQHLDFLTDPAICQKTLFVFLKHYQRETGCKRTIEVLVNLRELCSAAQAELSVTTDQTTGSNFVISDMIDRRNYTELSRSNNFYIVAGRMYLWRCLSEYCHSNAADEGDRCESLHFLLPDMVHFVNFIYNNLATWTSSMDSVQGILEEFIIFQLCLLTRMYDQTDQVGMEKWQSALETIISTRDLPNSVKVLEFAVYELFDLFYAKEKKLEEFLEWCCYRLNSFLTSDLNETEELPLTRALLLERGKNSLMSSETATEMNIENQLNSHNVHRALLFLRTIMRNPCTAKVTTFLRAAFDQVIDTYCTSLDPKIWVPLCEVIGIGVAIDGQIARERIHMLRSAIEVEGAPIRVKALALTAIASCAILRGYAATARLYYPEIAEDGTVKGKMLLQVFEGFIFSQDEELSFAAVESIGKILHYGNHCFPSALAECLLRYFDNSCQPQPFAFLDYFFSLYPASSTINQHKLVGALRDALKMLHKAEINDELMVNVDTKKMVNFVAKAVRKATLSASAKTELEKARQTYPPQFFLISCLLNWIINNAEGNLAAACLEGLAYTSPEEFAYHEKAFSYIFKMTSRCINVLFAHELDKLMPVIRRFEKRLTFAERSENDCTNDAKVKIEAKNEDVVE